LANGKKCTPPSLEFPSIFKGCLQNVHAVGDRANTLVIDAFESALQGINVTALRPRLEHAQIITQSDMRRLVKLGGM